MRVRIGQSPFQEEQMALYPRLLGPFWREGDHIGLEESQPVVYR